MVFANLTVMENLRNGRLPASDKAGSPKILEYIFGICPRLKTRVAGRWNAHRGEQQISPAVRALMSKPNASHSRQPSPVYAVCWVKTFFENSSRSKQQTRPDHFCSSYQNANLPWDVCTTCYVAENRRQIILEVKDTSRPCGKTRSARGLSCG